MNKNICIALSLILFFAGCSAATSNQGSSAAVSGKFNLSSPVMEDGGTLPADLKCTRNDGDGKSPPIAWSNAPAGTQSYAVIMHHYPRDKVAGVDTPSHYWLLWHVPADINELPRGNPESIGFEGGDKDKRYVGYTPPCSPGSAEHEYTITVYALDTEKISLGDNDDINVDWVALTAAIEGSVLASSSLTFKN